MVFGNLNYLPVLVAAIASFAFGAVWYSLLARQWMAARGMTDADMARAKAEMGPVPVPYIVAFVAELVMAWMFAGLLLHMDQGGLASSIRTGLISGFFLWLGFVATTMAVNHAFQGARTAQSMIDGGHWLGVLLIQGAVLGWWGVR